MTLASEGEMVRLRSQLLADGRVRTDSKTAAAAGMAVGTALGGIVGFIAGSTNACSECWFDLSPVAYAIGGAVLGGGAGTIVGALIKRPVWSRTAAPAASSGSFNGSLGAGDAVRFLHQDHKLTGIVTGGAGDTAIVRLASGTDTAVVLGSLERYVGERLNRGKNMAYGALGGAVVSVLAYVHASNDDYSAPVSVGQAVGRTALLTAFGAGMGYLMGERTRTAWTPVVPAQSRSLAITPLLSPSRVGVTARLEF
jgi:hypothetical protein